MLWKEICFVGPADCFSLHYFIVDCFSFHCTSHCIFQITTQKSFFERIMFRTNRFITIQNSNRLKTGDRLIITSSVTKDVYTRRCISLIRYTMRKYIPLKSGLFTSTLVVGNTAFLIKIDGWRDFMFRAFRALNTLKIYLNSSKMTVLIQIIIFRNVRIQMVLLKKNRFSAEEAKNYIPRIEKRKKLPVCEMLEISGFMSSTMLPILSWKLKMIAYRESSTIPSSSKLELFCPHEITSIVTKSSIINDLRVWDPPLVFLFSVQNITKKIKT